MPRGVSRSLGGDEGGMESPFAVGRAVAAPAVATEREVAHILSGWVAFACEGSVFSSLLRRTSDGHALSSSSSSHSSRCHVPSSVLVFSVAWLSSPGVLMRRPLCELVTLAIGEGMTSPEYVPLHL